MSEENTPQRDGQSDGPRGLTPKQRQAGLARLHDPSAPEYRIARRAGYSHWTARAPQRNGVDSFEFAGRVAHEAAITPSMAKKIGVATLAKLAKDEREPGGTRGAAAKALVDYGLNAPEDASSMGANVPQVAAWVQRIVVAALRCAVERPEVARRFLSRAPARIAALEEAARLQRLADNDLRRDDGG